MNVYEAAMERIDFLFSEFENIYISFSGGKDSGVCAHMVCEEARKRGRKVGLLHVDIEAAYANTMDFVGDIFAEYTDVIIPIWVCLPMTTDNGLSYYDQLWTWWDEEVKDRWVRNMPEGVYNVKNNPMTFYEYKMTFEDFVIEFAKNYSQVFGTPGKTACVIGIRTQESLNRWRAIHAEKGAFKDREFTTLVADGVCNFYPIYDWKTEDVWTYYGKTGKVYNRIYDLMYQAGVSIQSMRIDEPFGNEAKVGLKLFRVIEPHTWQKVVERVSGANIDNIYDDKSKKTRYNLPKGHTWESYTRFLLDTLPAESREHYERKFDTFKKWWIEKGSGMCESDIELLQERYGDSVTCTDKLSTRGNKNKRVVKFNQVLDTIPELDAKQDVLTWKRMAMAILKNDYWCKSLSFGLTKQQQQKRKETMEKYARIL